MRETRQTKLDTFDDDIDDEPRRESPATIQMKRELAGMAYNDQIEALKPSTEAMPPSAAMAVQAARGGLSGDVHQTAAQGVSGGGGALPHGDTIQQSFGNHDISGVKAHVGGKAEQANKALGAEAYATGSSIAFKSSPSLHTAAHEAAHVVQQASGVSLPGGVGSVGDKYEKHADKVADKVVAGESAAPVLNEMTGGGGGAGVQRQEGVQFAGGGTSGPSTGSGNSWEDYCSGLTGELQTAARSISDPAQQDKFKGLNDVKKGVFAKLRSAQAKSRFLAGGDPPDRIQLIVINAANLALYESLFGGAPATALPVFEAMTPDEWTDLGKMALNLCVDLLKDTTKLNDWRTGRATQALQANADVAAQLSLNKDDAAELETYLQPVAAGRAGERLRRVIADPAFESESTKGDFIKEVRDQVVVGHKEAWQAMTDSQGGYILKGTPCDISQKVDGLPVEITKAVPMVTLIQYNPASTDLIKRILDAASSHADCPKTTGVDASGSPAQVPDYSAWGGLSGDAKGALAGVYLSGGGSAAFDPMSDLTGFSLRSGFPMAYWMFDSAALVACMRAPTVGEIQAILAVEESTAYESGLVIFDLSEAGKQRLLNDPEGSKIRRPTAIDGLQFDQFMMVEDPDQSYGVTSGGAGEVIVGTVTNADVTVKRLVP